MSSTAAGPPGATILRPDVLIIGAGPAGLTAAADLARAGALDVLVVDRERVAGGIPRHSDHTGYGLRDLRRVLSGPVYARHLVERAEAGGAVIRTSAAVTGWTADGAAEVTTPAGRLQIAAAATILATGARERPRTARLVPGDRPAGVYTTGALQNLVHLHGGVPGTRAVVVGAELVSWSAVLTLRAAGCRTVAMLSAHSIPESYTALTIAGRFGLRVPVATRTEVVAIRGHGRVQAVEVRHLDTGERRTIACDTVVFTGDWIPDCELSRLAGLDHDPFSRGPVVDGAARTSAPGVFAAGNLVHPVDTADIAALGGRHAARQVRAHLAGARPAAAVSQISVEPPLRWVSPGLLRAGDPEPARGRLLLWGTDFVRRPHVSVHQHGQEIGHRRLPWPISPGRMFRVPYALLADAEPGHGGLSIGLR